MSNHNPSPLPGPDSPEPGTPGAPQPPVYGSPAPDYGAPPAPDYSAPPAPDYGTPPAPDYGTPPAVQPYGQPGGYGQPPDPGYPQAGSGYQGAPASYPAAPAGYPVTPGAPFGVDAHGRLYSDKSKIIAGILQLFLGTFGAGRWYTGHYGIAIAQLLTCGGLGIWALIDGIVLLVSDSTDPQGRILRS